MNPHVQIETATQLAVFLGNRPGALARVCSELAAAEINIHALATSDTIDHAVVRMVVSDPTKALMILGERGVLALENDVLMIESNNEPGTLATIAERLAKASINIEYAYLASTAKSQTGLMILRPSNVEKALRALHDLIRHVVRKLRTSFAAENFIARNPVRVPKIPQRNAFPASWRRSMYQRNILALLWTKASFIASAVLGRANRRRWPS